MWCRARNGVGDFSRTAGLDGFDDALVGRAKASGRERTDLPVTMHAPSTQTARSSLPWPAMLQALRGLRPATFFADCFPAAALAAAGFCAAFLAVFFAGRSWTVASGPPVRAALAPLTESGSGGCEAALPAVHLSGGVRVRVRVDPAGGRVA